MTAVRGGRIVAVEPGVIRVSLDAPAGCGGCACATGPQRALSVPWEGPLPAPGTRVEVSFPPAAREAVRVLLLPLLAAILAAALALAWRPSAPAGSAAAFVAALCVAGVLARRRGRGNLPSSVVSQASTDERRVTAFNQP
jgi:Positive regulator of sigma(E), RseC/MucC